MAERPDVSIDFVHHVHPFLKMYLHHYDIYRYCWKNICIIMYLSSRFLQTCEPDVKNTRIPQAFHRQNIESLRAPGRQFWLPDFLTNGFVKSRGKSMQSAQSQMLKEINAITIGAYTYCICSLCVKQVHEQLFNKFMRTNCSYPKHSKHIN